MCRKKKDIKTNSSEYVSTEVDMPISQPVPMTTKETDYFNEYYKAYKNDYVDQYLRAYHKYKETGEESDLLRELQGFDSDIKPQ